MQAAALLAGIGPTADEPLRAEIAKALELMLTQPRDELREPTAAVRALVKWATIDNLPALTMEIWSDNPFVKKHVQEALDRLQNEADPKTRKAIADAIIHGRDLARSETIPRALKTAKEGDSSTRISALQKLAKEPVDPNFQKAVVLTMMSLFADPNASVRENALGVLGVWARPSDLHALRALLDNQNSSVRSAAIKALSKAKDLEVIDKIVALVEERPLEREVRTAVRNYGPAAEPALLKLLENGSDQARTLACLMLETVGTEKCLPELRDAQQSPDSRLKAAARKATRTLERRLGSQSGVTPTPKRKSRPRSSPKQSGAESPSRNSNTPRDPE